MWVKDTAIAGTDLFTKGHVLGIDGNMDTDPDKGKLVSTDFRRAIKAQGLHSCLPQDVRERVLCGKGEVGLHLR